MLLVVRQGLEFVEDAARYVAVPPFIAKIGWDNFAVRKSSGKGDINMVVCTN
jgi:hypothetical protein